MDTDLAKSSWLPHRDAHCELNLVAEWCSTSTEHTVRLILNQSEGLVL